MSSVLENIKSRRSVRKFKSDMIPDDIIDKIIEAGLYAPSARGQQSSIIVCIKDKEIREEIVKLNCEIGGWDDGFDPFYGAPIILVVLAKKENANRVYDGSVVMQNLMLMANDLEVSSCWIHRAKEEFESEWGKLLLKKLGIDDEYEGIGHCALGYADGDIPAAHPINPDRVYKI